MLKKDKAILESLTRKYGKRNVVKNLNEAGDSLRGQYMLGRLERNRHDKDPHTSISAYRTARKYNDADEKMWKAYVQGWDDEGIDLPTLKRRNTKYNYEFHKNEDMNKICKQFINYIEKNDEVLQLIVDYMSGNQNGEKYSSPLPEVIPMFEDDVLGYECTPDMRKAIERAFNEWWHYAEAELMPEEYYDDIDESYRPRKSKKINESVGIFNLSKLEIIEEIIDGLDIPNRESTIKRCLRNTQEYLDSVYNLYLNEIDRGAHIDSIKSSCLKLMNKTNRRTIKRFYNE